MVGGMLLLSLPRLPPTLTQATLCLCSYGERAHAGPYLVRQGQLDTPCPGQRP